MKLYNIDLPPLCSCSSDFWESHPDTCANNCVFYKNHKGRSSCSSRGLSTDLAEGVCLNALGEISPGQKFPLVLGYCLQEKLMAARIASILQKEIGPAADRLNIVFN